MENPVSTKEGFTYEQQALFEHFRVNGKIDPVTRKPVKEDEIHPNINIKQAIDEFLKEYAFL